MNLGSRLLQQITTAPYGRMYGTGSRWTFRQPEIFGGGGYQVSPELMRNPSIIECVNLAAENYNKENNNKKLEFVDVVGCYVQRAAGRIYWFTSLFKDEAGNRKLYNGGVQMLTVNKLNLICFDPAPTHQQGFDFPNTYKKRYHMSSAT